MQALFGALALVTLVYSCIVGRLVTSTRWNSCLDCDIAAAACQMNERNCKNAWCAHAVVALFMCTALSVVVIM